MAQKSRPFDHSSNSEDFLKKVPLPPLPFKEKTSEKPEQKKSGEGQRRYTIEEALEKIKIMQQKQDSINRKLDQVYQAYGWSAEYVKSYIDNPNNFDPKEWEFLQREREKIMKGLKLPEEDKQKIRDFISKEKNIKTTKKLNKKKGPAVRRNWIPMK